MAELLGRRDECEALDRLVADVLAGASRVLVLRGEAGVGKSALLAYLSGRVTDEPGEGVGGKSRRPSGWNRKWTWPTAACISCARLC